MIANVTTGSILETQQALFPLNSNPLLYIFIIQFGAQQLSSHQNKSQLNAYHQAEAYQ